MQIVNEIIEDARIAAEMRLKNRNHTATAKTVEIMKVLAERVERAEKNAKEWQERAHRQIELSK